MAPRVNLLVIAILAGIEAGAATALSVLQQGAERVAEDCPHENTERVAGSTMGNLRMKCRDCGKELEQ